MRDAAADHVLFQSTLSVRRATRRQLHALPHEHISIHALRKESDGICLIELTSILISIHALRKESDPPMWGLSNFPTHFNPRSP